ncbi:MAG: T9SS type A sorting domain-containing protein [Candidatus Latescibacteria bacterium]|nr:T9SS type A sorting domain-containing protein [Candidatus Latescibacterota bacterium]
MHYLLFPLFWLGLFVCHSSATESVWQEREDFEQLFLHQVRPGQGQLALKAYGPLLRRYSWDTQPAIGFKLWEGEHGQRRDVPTGFWHDPETDEIYIGTGGGSGFTVLDPWKERSVTYRNQGIWDTTEDAEGRLLRADWTFAPYRSPDPGLLFDLTIYSARRLAGTDDIVLTTNAAGIQLIRRGDPDTYADDVLDKELWWLGSRAGITSVAHHIYEDTAGGLYIDLTHSRGLLVVQPDGRYATVHGYWGATVKTGPEGLQVIHTPKMASANMSRPLFVGRSGDLYVGTLAFYDLSIPPGVTGMGLTILQDFDQDSFHYTRSLNYRTTGLWNTTEQVGLGSFADNNNSFVDIEDETSTDHLITRAQRLPGSAVYHGWEDAEGTVYLGTSDGLALLRVDGQVETVPAFAGRLVFSSFKTPEGDLYLNTDWGLEVLHPDGTAGQLRLRPGQYPSRRVIYPSPNTEILPFWLDRAGHLNASIRGEGVEVYAPNLAGTATSFPVDASGLAQPRLRWAGSGGVAVESRTGPASSAYVNAFADGVQTAAVVAALDTTFARQQDGDLLTLSRRSAPFDEIAWLALPREFAAGSTVQIRARLRSDFQLPEHILSIGMVFADSLGRQSEPVRIQLRKENWALFSARADQPFDRIGLSWRYLGGSPIDLDYLAVVSPQGWSDWQALGQAAGTPVPHFDAEHPLVQWRTLLSRPEAGSRLPVLTGVWLEETPATAVAEVAATQPGQPSLLANYPNPFNQGTTIRFVLDRAGPIDLSVFNLAGQPVRRLAADIWTAGSHAVRWDGRTDNGRELASGVYLYRLRTDGGPVLTRRLLLLR